MVIRKRRFRFTKAEHERVRHAVREAEMSTTGEIVPFVLPACKGYRWVHGLLALAGISLATLALAISRKDHLWDVRIQQTVLWQSIGAVAGLLLSMIPAVKRLLVPSLWMAEEVHQRALASFVTARLTETRDRNGVLIFIALFERRVEILADRGIDSLAPQGYWEERVRQIVEGVHEGQPIEALCASIAEIGKLLSEKHPSTGDRANQLPDGLRER